MKFPSKGYCNDNQGIYLFSFFYFIVMRNCPAVTRDYISSSLSAVFGSLVTQMQASISFRQ